MSDNKFQEQIEAAVRNHVAETSEPTLTAMLAQFDELRAAGERVEFRIDMNRETISIVKIATVSIDLPEVEAEEVA